METILAGITGVFHPVFARKLFDISWSDLVYGNLLAFSPSSSKHEKAAIEQLDDLWAPGQTLPTLSVRSALDLLLQACAFTPGSEILMSAVTIPHMVTIIRLHGLVPVPVDLCPEDASISLVDTVARITPKTKAILVAQLFGARQSLALLSELAHQHQLLLIEDCAQAFCGMSFVGSPQATVSMFSFGPIKTCTSFGGALVTIREPKLLEVMKSTQMAYPRQQRVAFLKKVIKYTVFKAITQSPYLYGAFVVSLKVLRKDHHSTITKLSHSLTLNGNLLSQLRLRPTTALLKLLAYRISNFDQPHSTAALLELRISPRSCRHLFSL